LRRLFIYFFMTMSIMFIMFISPVARAESEPPLIFDRLNREEGLSQNSVTSFCQDSRGYMWIGTLYGLNRYDGRRFTVYSTLVNTPNSLSFQIVTDIYEDSRGTLWVATLMGLNKFDPATDSFKGYYPAGEPQEQNKNGIYDIYEDRSGRFWLATPGGLTEFNRETETFTFYRQKTEENTILGINYIKTIHEDWSGILWLGTAGGGLSAFDRRNSTFTNYEPNPDEIGKLNDNFVQAICEDHSGNLWIGTGNGGLNHFDRRKQIFTHYMHDPDNPNSISDNCINRLLTDSNGRIWIGTKLGGIDIYDPQKKRFLHNRHLPDNTTSISGNHIEAIFEDRSGLIWIGTFGGGISLYNKRRRIFTAFKPPFHSSYRFEPYAISSIHEDADGKLWVGTVFGLYNVQRPEGKFTRFPLESLRGTIMAIQDDHTDSGRLWVGCSKGVFHLDLRNKSLIRHYSADTDPDTDSDTDSPNRLSSRFIRTLLRDSKGILWIGSYKCLDRLNPSTNTVTRSIPLAPPGQPGADEKGVHITVLMEDRQGALWVGSEKNGIFVSDINKKNFKNYRSSTETGSLSYDSIAHIFEDSTGTIWVSTLGKGLNRLNRETGTFKVYTKKDGLPHDIVAAVLEDDSGYLWLHTAFGLCRFNPRTETFKSYDRSSGLQSYEAISGSCYKSKNGELFFGGPQGFNAFFPSRIKENTSVPPIYINGFTLVNHPERSEQIDTRLSRNAYITTKADAEEITEITLGYKENIFSIRFTALDYTAPYKNQYKYMMKGLHHRWIFLGNKNEVTFTGLEPGTYEFSVKGSNNDGYWNEEGASLIIRITPPFWKTWWFNMLLLLPVAAGLFLWHRSRVKNITHTLKAEAEMERYCASVQISKREREILDLLLEGKSNKDIENALFISLPTVKGHVSNIYKKVGVKSRYELISFFKER